MRKNVVILQHKLMHYRIPFFEVLKEKAEKEDYNVVVVHGQPSNADACRDDVGRISWSNVVKNKYFSYGDVQVMWQPFPFKITDVDLLIVMQENKILSNYYLILLFKLLRKPIAYWGHGKNFQSTNPTGLKETFKKILVNSVDWWFAYTKTSTDVIEKTGFSSEKISCLNNAIDTIAFRQDIESIEESEIANVRKELGISDNTFVGLFCSSLYPEKRLEFLLDACSILKDMLDDFCMIIIGEGPMSGYIKEFSSNNSWFKHVGVKKGRQKALYFKIANIVLNPGLLGLHILDAFCAGIPIVSLTTSLHSPEISYIKNNENGLLVDGDAINYAEKVANLLSDKKRYQDICQNAYKSGFEYSVEGMADNFFGGIKQILNKPRT